MKYLAIASVAAALGLSVGAVQAQSSTAAKPAATKNAPAKTAAKKPASKTASKGKVPAKIELIADMPHSMPWYPRHQTQTLGLIEEFLAKECGPGGL